MNKNILIIVPNLSGSGAEKVVIRQANLLEKSGNKVLLILIENIIAHEADFFGLQVISLTNKKNIFKVFGRLGDEIYAKILINKIKHLNFFPDIVFSHLPRADRIAKCLPFRKVFFIHTSYLEEIKNFLPKRAKKKTRLYKFLYENENIITVSKAMNADFLALGVNVKTMETIYNPFNFSEIIRKSNEFIPKIDFEYVAFPNAFRDLKRYDIMFSALKKIEHPVKLLVLANKTKEMMRLIEKYDVSEKVCVLGFQKNPFPYLKHAKLTVLSSEREGLPTVLIESLILGTPIVSTDCPTGPREILKGSLSNWLVPVGDADALAKKINEALVSSIIIEESHIKDFMSENIMDKYVRLLENFT